MKFSSQFPPGKIRHLRGLARVIRKVNPRAVTFVIFLQIPLAVLIKSRFCAGIIDMDNLVFFLIAQLNLALGVAGLFWPEKLMPLFGLLMFPWPASYRSIRVNGIIAIGAYLLVVGKLLATGI